MGSKSLEECLKMEWLLLNNSCKDNPIVENNDCKGAVL